MRIINIADALTLKSKLKLNSREESLIIHIQIAIMNINQNILDHHIHRLLLRAGQATQVHHKAIQAKVVTVEIIKDHLEGILAILIIIQKKKIGIIIEREALLEIEIVSTKNQLENMKKMTKEHPIIATNI